MNKKNKESNLKTVIIISTLLAIFVVAITIFTIKISPQENTRIEEIKWCVNVAKEDYNMSNPTCQGDEFRMYETSSSGTNCICKELLDNPCINWTETKNSRSCKQYKYDYEDIQVFEFETTIFFEIK